MKGVLIPRILFSGLIIACGLLVSALPASAAPCTSACLRVSPTTGVTNREALSVSVHMAAPGTEVAIVECNVNLAGGDSNACNQNPADLGKPGGPALAVTNSGGYAAISYKVLVSATKAIGDGTCAPGGDTCFVLVASVATMMPLGAPVPFSTAGGSSD
jgi:hypothetical protein